MTPEEKLWAAVLESAVSWFRDTMNLGIGSFSWICTELNLTKEKMP